MDTLHLAGLDAQPETDNANQARLVKRLHFLSPSSAKEWSLVEKEKLSRFIDSERKGDYIQFALRFIQANYFPALDS